MKFVNNHNFFDKLEYNVCKKKEYFTLTNTSLNYSTKKEQDFSTLFLNILNLTDDELNNLGEHIGVLNHVIDNDNKDFNKEKILINKAKTYINSVISNTPSSNYDIFKIACQFGYFKQIASIEYYDLKNIPFRANDDIGNISNIIDYCKKNKLKKVTKYEIKEFEDFIVASLSEIFKSRRTIMKCVNCSKYFLPLRNDACYCNNPSPQDPSKTCKKIMPGINFTESLKKDDDKKLHRKISKNLNKNAHREEFDLYKKKAKKFKLESLEMKRKLKLGDITKEEYSRWIREIDSKR